MTIEEKLKAIHDDFSHNVTFIYKRDDLLMAIDLVYHSTQKFFFQGKLIKKGWAECLIIGDTRCGKTETAERLIEHYKLGALSSGENTTFAGLVGGLQQTQKRWNIIWGKIPLNDRKLLFIDEVSGLSYEDIANMSQVRSSGVAELTKIQAEKAHARTRLVWLSNPRLDQPIDYFNSGIDVIKDLIGKPEDIARFDFVLLLSNKEVQSKEIEEQAIVKVKPTYTSQLCRNLILWTWSRKPENIIISKKAEHAIIEASRFICGKYSGDLPIVTATEQKVKMARLAISLACRLFSTDDGVNVMVMPEHAKYIGTYLDSIYSKTAFSYDVWSKGRETLLKIEDENEVRTRLERFGTSFAATLLDIKQIRLTDIEETLGVDRATARSMISFLVAKRALKKQYSYYQKVPAFIALLRDMQNGQPVNALEPDEAIRLAQEMFGGRIVKERELL